MQNDLLVSKPSDFFFVPLISFSTVNIDYIILRVD
jgi:hypothetical protein